MRILVPVDGSVAARNAVAYALSLARDRPQAVIVLLNVQNRQTLGLSDIAPEPNNEGRIAARHFAAALRNAARACTDAGVRFEHRAELGPIAITIARVAKQALADQIVMGTRGLGRLGDLVLGSVALDVVHAYSSNPDQGHRKATPYAEIAIAHQTQPTGRVKKHQFPSRRMGRLRRSSEERPSSRTD